MMYSGLIKKAMRIAFDAHRDQVDKAGVPYIFHPFHLAEQMETEDEVIVALMHDVVEDTDMTLKNLCVLGFSSEVTEALSLLTHEDGVPYMTYIEAIACNPLAAKVKLADLRHNSDMTRLEEIDDKVLARIEQYKSAIALLRERTDLPL